MPFKCCVPCCSGGKAKDNDKQISMHRFPKDVNLRTTWINNIHRKDFVPTENTRICSQHFYEKDFITESRDGNIYREKKSIRLKLLKIDAIPLIFKDQPCYFTKQEVVRRSDNSCAEKRRLLQV